MIRYLIVCSLLIAGSLSAFSQPAESNWFKVESDKTFSLHGENINPAAFFQKLSFHSGVEIRHEKSLHKGLYFELDNATLKELFRFVDAEFSTLKSYSSNDLGENVLTSLSILPKGQFQTSELVLAYDPVKEAVDHKQNKTSEVSKKVYVTRMEQLEIKVREQLENLANAQIENQEKQSVQRKERQDRKEVKRKEVVADLVKLKNEDPEIYQRKLEVLSWRYPNLEESVSNGEVVSQEN